MSSCKIVAQIANESRSIAAEKPEDLFRYMSGRWLVNEQAQNELHYVKFNLHSLNSEQKEQIANSNDLTLRSKD